MSSQIHGEPTDNDGHGAVSTAGDQEEGSILRVFVVMDNHQHGKACYGDTDRYDGEEKSMARPIRKHSHEHAETKSSGPRGNRV